MSFKEEDAEGFQDIPGDFWFIFVVVITDYGLANFSFIYQPITRERRVCKRDTLSADYAHKVLLLGDRTV